MSHTSICPSCGSPVRGLGQSKRCQKCGARFAVPGAPAAQPKPIKTADAPAKRPRWRLWFVGAVLLGILIAVVWQRQRPSKSSTPALDAIPLPPFTPSRYLNVGADARYVGIGVCAECHPAYHKSYLLTAHSKALGDLDPATQPGDGDFQHARSGRSYRVYRADNQFRHSEMLKADDGREVASFDFPIRYQIGSGHLARSYFVDVDGFLLVSPLTWYEPKKKWDVSPGYEVAWHGSFERTAGIICMGCHSGHAEQAADSVRVTLHEKAIGCENCHGPGSKHVELRRAKKQVPGDEDLTIVNPGNLSREHLESVCAVCHLSGIAVVPVRGRQHNDFRPGRPLADYLVNYRFDAGSEKMTVAGHMEQLRRSACYQRSSELTCITCHDPHAKEKPKDTVAYYRQKCLDCHNTKGCRVAPAERLKQQPADDCSACHMPRGQIEIPHVAFTHHRIGKHPAPAAPAVRGPQKLVPIDSVAHLPMVDQKHNLGLAYLSLFDRNTDYAEHAEVFRQRALQLLEPLYEAGMRDGVTCQALARLWWRTDLARAFAFAEQALADKTLPANYRDVVLAVCVDKHFQDRNAEAARAALEELTRIRRESEDWRNLGRVCMGQGQPQQALSAYHKALAIQPYRGDIHAEIANVYAALGDNVRAGEHLQKAQTLAKRQLP